LRSKKNYVPFDVVSLYQDSLKSSFGFDIYTPIGNNISTQDKKIRHRKIMNIRRRNSQSQTADPVNSDLGNAYNQSWYF